MKFERLKKSHKKQIVIGVVAVCIIGGALTFTTSRARYRLTQSMKLVTGTINYKVPDMRVVAVNISEDGTNYEIANEIPESGYTLNEEKSLCKVATETSGIENAPKDNNVTIEYIEGKLNIRGVSKRNTRCYLYFDKYVEPTSETTLAKLNINSSYIKSGNPDFTKTATGAETVADNGIYKTLDPMYGENAETYYWRGAATTNHVIFANKCWRIIRINGDGTIRLIYNGTPSGTAPNQTCPGNGSNSGSIAVTSQTYNASRNNASYVGYTYTVSEPRPTPSTGGTASNLKTQTETWFDSNITGDNLNKVDMQGKYCNDRRPQTGQSYGTSSFNYAAYERLYTNKKPTLECDAQDVYTLKAGAITADEVSMAGGVYGTSNSSYYLYNNAYYWTMSPYHWSSGYAYVFLVSYNGNLNYTNVNGTTIGVRPVINLKSNTEFATGGEGTATKPYVVS